MGEVIRFPDERAGSTCPSPHAEATVLSTSGGDAVEEIPQKVPREELTFSLSEDDPKIDFACFDKTPFIDPKKCAPAPVVELEKKAQEKAPEVTGRLMHYSPFSHGEREHVARTVRSVEGVSNALAIFEDSIAAFEQTATVQGVGPGLSSVPFQEFMMEVNASYKAFHADFKRMKHNLGALKEVTEKHK